MRAAPANQLDQAFPRRRRQPFRSASAAHSIRSLPFDRVRARQPLRHARGALGEARPTDPPDSQ